MAMSPATLHKFFCIVAIVSIACVGIRALDDAHKEAREAALTKLEKPLEQMRVKELQALLSERGVECVACTEKHDVVERVRETIHLPLKTTDEETEGDVDDTNIEEILKKLQDNPAMQGMNFQTFKASDMEKLKQAMKDNEGSQGLDEDEGGADEL